MLPAMQQAMSSAQARYETQANWTRDAAPKYQIGDSVWLDLSNYSTDHPSKKLDVKNAQFRVTQVVSPHTYWLDTPGNIHNIFHVSLFVAVHTVPPDQVHLIGSTGLDSGLVLAERSVKERVSVLRDSTCGLLRTVLHTRRGLY